MRRRSITKVAGILGASLAVLFMIGCTEEASSGAGEDPFGGDAVSGSGERNVEDAPQLTRLWEDGPSVGPRVFPEAVREQATAFDTKWGIKLYGDWTPESVQRLDEVLDGTYGETKEVFANLTHFHMTESGRIAEGTPSANYGGLFTPGACTTPSGDDCWSVADHDPVTGHIDFWGAKEEVGNVQVRKDILQHELGHYFAVAHAKDKSWRDRWREAAKDTETVSAYAQGNVEENYAEIWSKLFTEPGTAYGDFDWYKPVSTWFPHEKVPREAFTIIREVIKGPAREADFVQSASDSDEG